MDGNLTLVDGQHRVRTVADLDLVDKVAFGRTINFVDPDQLRD